MCGGFFTNRTPNRNRVVSDVCFLPAYWIDIIDFFVLIVHNLWTLERYCCSLYSCQRHLSERVARAACSEHHSRTVTGLIRLNATTGLMCFKLREGFFSFRKLNYLKISNSFFTTYCNTIYMLITHSLRSNPIVLVNVQNSLLNWGNIYYLSLMLVPISSVLH